MICCSTLVLFLSLKNRQVLFSTFEWLLWMFFVTGIVQEIEDRIVQNGRCAIYVTISICNRVPFFWRFFPGMIPLLWSVGLLVFTATFWTIKFVTGWQLRGEGYGHQSFTFSDGSSPASVVKRHSSAVLLMHFLKHCTILSIISESTRARLVNLFIKTLILTICQCCDRLFHSEHSFRPYW